MPTSLPSTVDGVLDRLRAIQDELPAGAPVALWWLDET